jgi:DNA-binding NtrC family response regulator
METETLISILLVHNNDNSIRSEFAISLRQTINLLEVDTLIEAKRLLLEQRNIHILFLNFSFSSKEQIDLIIDIHNQEPLMNIVFLSYSLNLATLRFANLLGCNEVLQLPIQQDELVAIINRYKNKKNLKINHELLI